MWPGFCEADVGAKFGKWMRAIRCSCMGGGDTSGGRGESVCANVHRRGDCTWFGGTAMEASFYIIDAMQYRSVAGNSRGQLD